MRPGDSVAWLNVNSAAAHLDMTPAAFRKFVERERTRKHGLKVHWLRGRMRFRRADLDRCLESEPDAVATTGPRLVVSR